MRASGPVLSTIQTKNSPQWMKRNGRLPLKSEIQSATFMTAVRLSSVSSLMLRDAVWRSSFARSRAGACPVAVSSSIAAAGRMRENSSRSPRSTTTASRSFVTSADAVRGPPSSSEISPKKSPARAVSSTMRSPVSFLKKISTSPARTMYSESPGSP